MATRIQIQPTALVVDDDAWTRALIIMVLNDLGIAALEAEDGLEAQCLAKEHPGLKLVITDFTIPHINGIELAAWLKTNRAEVKVLLISSSPDHIITFGIPPTSAFAFLAKPFTTADLTSKVRSIL